MISPRAREEGFTLVELLSVLLILGIILAGVYSLFLSQQRAFSAQEQIMELDEEIRSALDLMTREIRLAGYKTAGATFNGVTTASATSIHILADLDQDGVIGDPSTTNEDITYTYDAATLQIWRNSTSFPVAENVTGLNFFYTLKDGSMTTTPADLTAIRKVNISITGRTARPDPGTGQYRTLTVVSDVTLRNMGI